MAARLRDITKGGHRGEPGFRPAGALVEKQVRQAADNRGPGLSFLITRWETIVGQHLAKLCHPTALIARKQSLLASLQISVQASAAPIIDAQKREIVDRANAVFGYTFLDDIKILRAERGFAENAKKFENDRQPMQHDQPDLDAKPQQGVSDLSLELERLRQNISGKSKRNY